MSSQFGEIQAKNNNILLISVKSDEEQAGCCASTNKGENSSPETGKRKATDGI